MTGESNSSSNSRGCMSGVSGILLVAFVIMKALGLINWSWWWVLCPLWINIGLGVLVIGFLVAVTVCQL